jgi:hypothetical protein
LAKNPLFLVTYIYFLHFFFTLIKEKVGKWAEIPQSLVYQRFQPAHFSNKTGQKPTFFGQNRIYKSLNSPKYIKFLKESGQKPVFQNKSGHNFCA